MALLTLTALRDEAARQANRPEEVLKSILSEQSAGAVGLGHTYNVFLSHSRLDAPAILGLKSRLEQEGCSVYIDWIDDPNLQRGNVSPKTAAYLRERMRTCASLLYAFSLAAGESRWMPWELGYFDGMRGLVAVAPLSVGPTSSYEGREYLGLYPYMDDAPQNGTAVSRLWINEGKKYVLFKEWLKGELPRAY